MQINIGRFFFDEKEIFVMIFAVFIIVTAYMGISIEPFRRDSLMVLLFYLLLTRSVVSYVKFGSYFYIALIGLLLSLFLSPYGLAIFLLIAIILYTKTNLI